MNYCETELLNAVQNALTNKFVTYQFMKARKSWKHNFVNMIGMAHEYGILEGLSSELSGNNIGSCFMLPRPIFYYNCCANTTK